MAVKLKDRDGMYHAVGTLTLPSGVKVTVRRTTGYPVGQKQLAQIRMANIIQEEIDGALSAKTKSGKPEITVEDACRKYHAGRGHEVGRTDRAYIKKFAAKYGAKLLSELNKVEVREWAEAKGERGPSTVRRAVTSVNAVINYCREYGYHVPEELKVKRPPEGEGRDRWLTLQQRDEFIAEFRDIYWEIALVLFYTGGRIGEVLGLQVTDVTPEGVVYATRKGKGKLRKRTVPLHDALRPIIEARCEASRKAGKTHVFAAARGKHVDYKTFLEKWHEVCALLKVEDFNIHDARHTFATLLAMTGTVDLQELAELLGHTNLNMVSRYRHLIPARQKLGINTLGVICTTPAQSIKSMKKDDPTVSNFLSVVMLCKAA